MTPSDRHVPFRTCVGCRRRRPQAELVRCVLDADGNARVSRTAPGRGAWLCGPDCLDRARRGLERAWRRGPVPHADEQLRNELSGPTN